MKGVLSTVLVTLAAAHSHEADNAAGKAAAAWCAIADTMGNPERLASKSVAEFNALLGKFAVMMAPEVDCSYDANNPEFGFDLKGVPYEACQAATMKLIANLNEKTGGVLAKASQCTTIVDAEANTAAMLSEATMSISGKSFKTTQVIHINMVGEKIAGYHQHQDTFNFLNNPTAGKAAAAWCAVIDTIGNPHLLASKSKEEIDAILGKFAGMMAPKVDCSNNANNPETGFDLMGVPYEACQAATETFIANINEKTGGFQAEMKCTETIVDAEANTAAIFTEATFSGSGKPFKSTSVTHFNMVGEKIAGYHQNQDTFNVLNNPTAGKAAAAWCAVVDAIGNPHLLATKSKEEIEALMGSIAGLMAPKVECSNNANNPEMGFDLKGVPYEDCAVATLKGIALINEKTGGLQMSAKCTETIVDAEANTAAMFTEATFSMSGKPFKSTMVTHINMAGEKIAGYHSNSDTFNLLINADAATSLAEIHSSNMFAGGAACALALAGAFALGISFAKKSDKKSYVLMSDDTA